MNTIAAQGMFDGLADPVILVSEYFIFSWFNTDDLLVSGPECLNEMDVECHCCTKHTRSYFGNDEYEYITCQWTVYIVY